MSDAKILKFPSHPNVKKIGSEESILKDMITSSYIESAVFQVLGSLGTGTEFKYDGPMVDVGVSMGYVDLDYGNCDMRRLDADDYLIVHDTFPLALESLGVPGEKSWFTSALFAGLKEAVHSRAVWPGNAMTKRIDSIEHSGVKRELWQPGVGPKSIALNRFVAGLTIEYMGVESGSLEPVNEPPFPSHIAGFLNPLKEI